MEERRIQAEIYKEWSRQRDDLECDDLKVCFRKKFDNRAHKLLQTINLIKTSLGSSMVCPSIVLEVNSLSV